MANTWVSLRAAIEAAVTNAMLTTVSAPTNGDGPAVSWFDGPRPFAKHRIILQELSDVPEYDRDTALYQGGAQALTTLKSITVQVTFESTHDDPSLNARWLVEQVRLGLRRVSVREELATAGVVIASFPGPVTGRSYTADDRTVSAAGFDVTFRTEFAFVVDDDAGLIEQVIGEGTGALADIAIDVTDPDPEP